MWCRLFRSVPAWKREATRAEAALVAAEEAEEVFEPGGWWFHNDEHHPFRWLLGSPNCQTCGLPRRPVKPKPMSDVERERWRKLGEQLFNSSQGSVVGDATETSPTVGDVTPPWGDANQLLDHIAELVDYHQFHPRSTVMFGYCTGCSWTAWGELTQSTRRAHAGHVAELVMDRLQAEHRIANTGKTAP